MDYQVSYTYQMEDSTSALNEHFTGILEPGIYAGFLVLADGSNVNVTPGSVLDANGRLIKLLNQIPLAVDPNTHPTYDRIDTVYLRHFYSTASPDTEQPVVLIARGTPSKVPIPASIPFEIGNSATSLATVVVRPGSNIVQSDIAMAERIGTLGGYKVNESEATALNIFGNRKLAGLEVSVDGNDVVVSPGTALIEGRYQSLEAEGRLTMPAYTTVLALITGINISSVTPTTQPTAVSRLRVSVTLNSHCVNGVITLIGKDHTGTLVTETVAEKTTDSTDTLFIFESAKFYSSVASIQLIGFDGSVRKTGVKLEALNERFIYMKKHGYRSMSPVLSSPVMIEADSHLLLGKVGVTSELQGGSNVITGVEPLESGPSRMRLLTGNFYTVNLNGMAGAEVVHNYDLAPEDYSVAISPMPASYNDATLLGITWPVKERNRVVVYSTDNLACPCEVTIFVRG